MIVVFDASSLVSAALKENSVPERALVLALQSQNQIIWSDEIMAEYQNVLGRPKFAPAIPPERRDFILGAIRMFGRHIKPSMIIEECADPKDDKYLSLAASGQADVIVSSDNHLLTLHPWRGIPIVKPADFLTGSSLKLS